MTRLYGSDLPFMDRAHRFEDEEGERMPVALESGLPEIIHARACLPPSQPFHWFRLADNVRTLIEYYDIDGNVKWSFIEVDKLAARYYAGWRT